LIGAPRGSRATSSCRSPAIRAAARLPELTGNDGQGNVAGTVITSSMILESSPRDGAAGFSRRSSVSCWAAPDSARQGTCRRNVGPVGNRHNWPTLLGKPVDMRVAPRSAVPPALLLLLSIGLEGCVTSNAGSSPMDSRAEAPKSAPSRVYMPLEDTPSDRRTPALTADEQSKLKKELTGVRDGQAAKAKAQNDH
jgi:hypothetical protein